VSINVAGTLAFRNTLVDLVSIIAFFVALKGFPQYLVQKKNSICISEYYISFITDIYYVLFICEYVMFVVTI
jgi:hypothetical protein